MRKTPNFDKRLEAVSSRHCAARGLFDQAVDELEQAAEDFTQLECDIQNRIEELQGQADEAANGAAQANRVARKIRELLS